MPGRLLQVVGAEAESVTARQRKLEAVSPAAAVPTGTRSPGRETGGRRSAWCPGSSVRRRGGRPPAAPARACSRDLPAAGAIGCRRRPQSVLAAGIPREQMLCGGRCCSSALESDPRALAGGVKGREKDSAFQLAQE